MILCATALCLCMIGRATHADVLVGPNGERLPGHVVEEKDGMLIFESDFLGRVQLRADNAHVERDSAPAATVLPEKPSAQASRPRTLPRLVSDLGISVGQDRGSLKTLEDKLDGTWKLSRQTANGELAGTLTYKYKRTDNVLKNDDWFGSISYDKFLSDDHFLSGRALGLNELTSEGYESTGIFGLSAGWRLFEESDRYLRIGPAIGYMTLTRGGQTFDGVAAGLYARTVYPIFRRITFEGELQILSAAHGNTYAISQLRLKRPLTPRVYLAVDWLYSWSHVDIESGIKSEWRWVLGWTFDSSKQD